MMSDTMPRNLKPVTGYVSPETLEALQELADSQHRSLSSLIAMVLSEYVKKSKEAVDEAVDS